MKPAISYATVAPYRQQIKKFDFTEARAIDQLFKWQMGIRPEDVTPETQGASRRGDQPLSKPQLVRSTFDSCRVDAIERHSA